MLIVATICNNSLGPVEKVETWKEGLTRATEIAEAKLGRPMNQDESGQLVNDNEFYCDDDPSNVWTVSIGGVE